MTPLVQKLQQIVKQLPSAQQQTVLAFAEFLLTQQRAQEDEKPAVLAEPKLLPRPQDESVIAAIKRLAQSYPMLDKAVMLNETSHLMTEHLLQGRDRASVIDNLEQIFWQHYQTYRREN
jgi:hypothetical protein